MNKPIEIDARAAAAQLAKLRNASPNHPGQNCPYCGERGKVRTSAEMSPSTRIVRYTCPKFECSASWESAVEIQRIVSPSGLGKEFRPFEARVTKPPGHEFGQTPLIAPQPKA